ncbi:MAG: putative maltokinase, partial [Planctomycetes bacterium]|nr:putative maltokinase [Planctomycetota bacterium]
QTDLNLENPEVRQAMFKAIDLWLELCVDGASLDAVPYLFEREGTNCEILPETHAYLRELRAHVDEKFDDKMLLAEANQWPEDAAAYFGAGDECHMNFHFPLMPRLFMSVEREDRFPIIDILDQTPALPETSQWAIFLRNHDELTLEMVTDEERDYMYRAYASDFRARVNLGIRRRLAPLLRNNRRKVELMNGLLLSLPGTPIIYYGDEIAMGDNIYLGDRDAVRTPMQWSADRNAGFSQTNPQRLFLPTIIDPEYHFALRNVEVEQNSPHSLLWWMRRIINIRKHYRAFGRGSFEFVKPENPKVLAYLRQFEGEALLVVANLSRFPQAAEFDLSRFRGHTPIEMFGQIRFPPIGELPYFLTLGPHSFYWFRIQQLEETPTDLPPSGLPKVRIDGDWDALFQGRSKTKLEQVLPAFLRRHRWFGGKAKTIQGAELLDWFPIEGASKSSPMRLLLVRIDYNEGEPDRYLVPTVFADEEQAANIQGDHPVGGILQVERSGRKQSAMLCEATWEREFWAPLLDSIARKRTIAGAKGELRAVQTKAFRRLYGEGVDGAPSVHGGEQSNTSAVFDNRVILKLFRRLSPGVNPDLEIGRFLTEKAPLEHVPHVAGALEYVAGKGETMTAAILHQYVPNQGDAWVFTLDELSRYLERVQSEPGTEPGFDRLTTTADAERSPAHPLRGGNGAPAATERESPQEVVAAVKKAALLDLADRDPPFIARELIGLYLPAAELLGQRTAEMHLALASAEADPAFTPEAFSKLYQRSLYQSMRTQARKAVDLLRKQTKRLPEALHGPAEQIAKREDAILDQFRQLVDHKIAAQRVRCHGDLHLGQVLYTGRDFAIIDFEGEPDRPVSERRIKASPLRDVAGMVRSFHYASHAARLRLAPGVAMARDAEVAVEDWLHFWYAWTTATFLRAYFRTAGAGQFLPESRDERHALLSAYLLEKALYELGYELNNRPDWANIPMEGILELLR